MLIPEGLRRSLTFEFLNIASQMAMHASGRIRDIAGVGFTEWKAMAILAWEPGIYATRISEIAGLDRSVLSRALEQLRLRDLVRAEGDPDHARRVKLYLTEQGRTLYEDSQSAIRAAEEELLAVLTGGERLLMRELLERLDQHMESLLQQQQ